MAARATASPQETPAKRDTDPAHLEEQIRQRAYALYLQREGEDGSALDDWLRAETEITHTVEQNYVHRDEADANAGSE